MKKRTKTQKMMFDRDAYIRLVCDMMRLKPQAVMSRCKDQRASMARQLVMWAMRRKGYTTMQIGFAMARTHGTVLHDVNKVEGLIELQLPFTKEWREIANKCLTIN